jgi:hypothetical protein
MYIVVFPVLWMSIMIYGCFYSLWEIAWGKVSYFSVVGAMKQYHILLPDISRMLLCIELVLVFLIWARGNNYCSR